MGIERARVLEIDAGAGAGIGSGYLVDDRLVLTAGAGRVPARLRPAGTATWLAASPVWSSAAGVAVLELDDPSALMMPPIRPRWGRITGRRPVAVAAMGFSPAETPTRWARDAEHFFGHVVPSEPASASMPVTGWTGSAGMTGAALFAGAELVGVLLTGARAAPVGALAGEPGFSALVGDQHGLLLADVSTPATAFPIF